MKDPNDKLTKELFKYPDWICADCGDKYGNKECGVSTWHMDICDICGETKPVTEPRDFGHLKKGWENK